ncbi:MAG: response regulator [Deltaproteobacteria bacterium]|nr:response regulator [Deltaproteobacteria bacterium]
MKLEGDRPLCLPFFLVTKGFMINAPRALGLPPSSVDMTMLPRGARYVVNMPQGGGLLHRFRRALMSPFTGAAIARELKDANEALQARYQQLEHAGALLDHQARQLRTAHAISQRVHRSINLSESMDAITKALVEEGGFAWAELEVRSEIEGRPIQRRLAKGEHPTHALMIEYPLDSRGAPLGFLRLNAQPADDVAERRELLEYVVPTVAMALRDALTFAAVIDYRENLELKVVERTKELQEARDDLSATVQQLREAQAVRERIFANINHEIRTPLALIRLAADQLRRAIPDLTAGQLKELYAIDENVRRLLGLVDELLLLAASQEGKLVVRPAPRDIGTLVRQVVGAFLPAAESTGVTLGLTAPERCVAVVDGAAFERIVTNLISNALKFTPVEGRVEVEVLEKRDHFELHVRDTGIGIDEEFKKRIFGRFEQGRAPVRSGARGSGLGLSLVKELAEAHGGRVVVESNRGGGSTFSVVLPRKVPLRPSITAAEVAPEARSLDLEPPRVASGPRIIEADRLPAEATILVAEDEPALLESVGQLLRPTYRVLLAPDGLTALRLAGEHRPDLLISDVGMPGMDGFELTRRFRELSGNRLASSILLTAFAATHDRLAGLRAGAVDYVMKPFHPEELLARVQAQLQLRRLALKLHDSERLSALGSLSAGLAHEIRNPANAIVNAIYPLRKLLPKEAIDPESPGGQLFEVVADAAGQIGQLSKQLLGFVRGGEPQLGEVRLDELVHRSMNLVAPVLKPVEVKLDLQHAGPFLCAQSPLLQVLMNLLENAAHAAGPGGWIRVHSERSERAVRIEVSDSGPGVPQAIRDRIFDPFFTTKPPGEGTGLGLPTARQIVEQHKGTLSLLDTGQGAHFRVELPQPPVELPSSTTASTDSGGRATI